MKIIFLGTNGWYSSPTGDTPCILIDSKDHYVIFDAGNGIHKLDQYITEDKPISLFISHFHLDHVSGVSILHKFKFRQGIDIYVGESRKKDIETLCNPPYTLGFQNKELDLRLNELSDSEINSPFKIKAIKLEHLYDDHGYRVELENKIIAYTGDGGLTDATRNLAKNADLLISECTNKKTENPKEGHLDPMEAATLAKEVGVKQLILTHFGPIKYPTSDDRKWAEQEAKKIFPATTAANDGMEFEL
jgi:ribonuclease BN (tRNA processing enzyme)